LSNLFLGSFGFFTLSASPIANISLPVDFGKQLSQTLGRANVWSFD